MQTGKYLLISTDVFGGYMRIFLSAKETSASPRITLSAKETMLNYMESTSRILVGLY